MLSVIEIVHRQKHLVSTSEISRLVGICRCTGLVRFRHRLMAKRKNCMLDKFGAYEYASVKVFVKCMVGLGEGRILK